MGPCAQPAKPEGQCVGGTNQGGEQGTGAGSDSGRGFTTCDCRVIDVSDGKHGDKRVEVLYQVRVKSVVREVSHAPPTCPPDQVQTSKLLNHQNSLEGGGVASTGAQTTTQKQTRTTAVGHNSPRGVAVAQDAVGAAGPGAQGTKGSQLVGQGLKQQATEAKQAVHQRVVVPKQPQAVSSLGKDQQQVVQTVSGACKTDKRHQSKASHQSQKLGSSPRGGPAELQLGQASGEKENQRAKVGGGQRVAAQSMEVGGSGRSVGGGRAPELQDRSRLEARKTPKNPQHRGGGVAGQVCTEGGAGGAGVEEHCGGSPSPGHRGLPERYRAERVKRGGGGAQRLEEKGKATTPHVDGAAVEAGNAEVEEGEQGMVDVRAECGDGAAQTENGVAGVGQITVNEKLNKINKGHTMNKRIENADQQQDGVGGNAVVVGSYAVGAGTSAVGVGSNAVGAGSNAIGVGTAASITTQQPATQSAVILAGKPGRSPKSGQQSGDPVSRSPENGPISAVPSPLSKSPLKLKINLRNVFSSQTVKLLTTVNRPVAGTSTANGTLAPTPAAPTSPAPTPRDPTTSAPHSPTSHAGASAGSSGRSAAAHRPLAQSTGVATSNGQEGLEGNSHSKVLPQQQHQRAHQTQAAQQNGVTSTPQPGIETKLRKQLLSIAGANPARAAKASARYGYGPDALRSGDRLKDVSVSKQRAPRHTSKPSDPVKRSADLVHVATQQLRPRSTRDHTPRSAKSTTSTRSARLGGNVPSSGCSSDGTGVAHADPSAASDTGVSSYITNAATNTPTAAHRALISRLQNVPVPPQTPASKNLQKPLKSKKRSGKHQSGTVERQSGVHKNNAVVGAPPPTTGHRSKVSGAPPEHSPQKGSRLGTVHAAPLHALERLNLAGHIIPKFRKFPDTQPKKDAVVEFKQLAQLERTSGAHVCARAATLDQLKPYLSRAKMWHSYSRNHDAWRRAEHARCALFHGYDFTETSGKLGVDCGGNSLGERAEECRASTLNYDKKSRRLIQRHSRTTQKLSSARLNGAFTPNGQARASSIHALTSLGSFSKRVRIGRSAIHGWGVFAVDAIKPGEFIVEYCGELIRKAVGDVREKCYEAIGMESSYLFRINNEYTVDATRIGAIARYVNHSCQPNCYTQIVDWKGGGGGKRGGGDARYREVSVKRILIICKNQVLPGGELFYDYKFEFEGEDQKIPCHCGAPGCRGFLN